MASLAVHRYLEMILDLLFQLRHMGNNADHPVPAGHLLQDPDRLFSGLVIERAEPFVDEHDIEAAPRPALPDPVSFTLVSFTLKSYTTQPPRSTLRLRSDPRDAEAV